MEIIGHVRTDFHEKFGIPRQGGLVENIGYIEFLPPFDVPVAFEGIEEYSHIWILWQFSENVGEGWSPMVRPPRLGGNVKVGVFASRSPFRPNPIGLSLVRLLSVEKSPTGGVLLKISGADILDGSPVYDIKPYLPHIEAIPGGDGGFAHRVKDDSLSVICSDTVKKEILKDFSLSDFELLREILSQDPRPHYHADPERVYGMAYKGQNIRFRVVGKELEILSLEKL